MEKYKRALLVGQDPTWREKFTIFPKFWFYENCYYKLQHSVCYRNIYGVNTSAFPESGTHDVLKDILFCDAFFHKHYINESGIFLHKGLANG